MSNKKKVLMCYHSARFGGVEQHILDIITGLSSSYDITVVCPDGPMVKKYLLAGAVKHIPLVSRFEADFVYMWKIYTLARNYDIVHAHEIKTGTHVMFSSWLARSQKRIYHVHTPFSQWQYTGFKKYSGFLVNFVLNFLAGNLWATDVIALTETIRDVKTNIEKVREDKIRIIPNGLDTAQYHRNEFGRRRIRKKWGVADRTLVIGNISRFTAEKGHETTLQAFSMLRQNLPHIQLRLVLAGGGVLLDEMKKRASELGIQQLVTFLGVFEDEEKKDILSGFDIFLFTTRAEGFGISMIEAMSMELPVVASNLPVLEDVAGQGALFASVTDPEQFAVQLERLISDRKLAFSLAKSARKQAALYSLQSFWQKYRALYA